MADKNNNFNTEMLQTLHELIRNWEHEIVEFKQASKDYEQDKIGRYFSAISNEANLKGLQYGWLVFGVHDTTRKIVGTDYGKKHGLEKIKNEIANNTTNRATFTDVFEIFDGDNRIVMFKIPAAVTSMPTAWKGHWYGREGESLSALSTDEFDRIRGQARWDWSKQVIEKSSVKHLDKEAVQKARENYKTKQNREHINEEVDNMSDEEFLTKIRLIIDGKLTNAAMVLLGNPDYDYLLDTPARVMWRLYGSDSMVKDYKEFNIPFISVVDKAYGKIRNLVYRYMPKPNTLFTSEIMKYNEDLLRELLNNCIAHQDYTTGGRIYLDEFEDVVVVSNPGSFIPGDIRKVLKAGYRAPYYRNQLIAESMVNFDMIDTVQMGIRKVFNIQRDRYFPMPDYNFSENNGVSVKVYGEILDKAYTHLLYGYDDLDLETVFLLDRVQKNLPLDKEQYKSLKSLGFIEGKIPNVYISLEVARKTGEKAQYIKNKGQGDEYYKKMIIDYLEKWGKGTKSDFVELLGDKLPDILDEKQKDNKIKYFLTALRKSGIIEHMDGNQRTGLWVLVKKD